MISNEFISVDALLEAFPTERSCITYLEGLRWENDVISPFDAFSKVYSCKDDRYRCRNTQKYFNVRTHTIFHNSKMDLRKWFIAIWLVSTAGDITSVALSKELEITQKSAWLLLKRIRKYIGVKNPAAQPKLSINDMDVIITPDKMKMTDWFTQL